MEKRIVVTEEENSNGTVIDGADRIRTETVAQRSSLSAFSDIFEEIQSLRVSCDVRLSHLALHYREDLLTTEARDRLLLQEKWADGQLRRIIMDHPTYQWWGRIHGMSFLTMARIVGEIERFGRFYDVGDPMIPYHLIGGDRKPVAIQLFNREGKPMEEKEVIWVEGIERFTTPGKLKKFAGLVPGQKLEEGKKASYNTSLKGMLWRLSTYSLLMKKKKYFNFFVNFREEKTKKLAIEGIKILPTPKGKWCVVCEEEMMVKAARYCPICENPLSPKTAPQDVIWKQHFYLQCVQRVQSLFLQHLWQVWRMAVRLPVVDPYPMAILGHDQSHYIDAWDMVDLEKPSVPKFLHREQRAEKIARLEDLED